VPTSFKKFKFEELIRRANQHLDELLAELAVLEETDEEQPTRD
jgi:hypothetical protein